MEPLASGSLLSDEPSLVTIKVTSVLELLDGLHKLDCENILQQCLWWTWHCLASSYFVTVSLTAGLQGPQASHGNQVTLLIIEVVPSYMSRKWWRSKARVATSPATCALLMKSRLWFADCLVHFRLLGYERWGRVGACLKFVSATVSHSVDFKTGTRVFLQTVFPSWKLWLAMLSHHREKSLSTFRIVDSVQEKIIFIASCSFCPQFISLLR